MRRLLILLTIITSHQAFAQTLTPDQVRAYLDSLSFPELKYRVQEAVRKQCENGKDPSYGTPEYSYCNCFSKQVIEQFKGNQIKDLILPSSHLRYITNQQRNDKLRMALQNTIKNCI